MKLFRNIVFFMAAVLLITEIVLRIPFTNERAKIIAHQKYVMTLLKRVNFLWLSSDKDDELLPPYTVFANLNQDNPEHLQEVFLKTRSRFNLKLTSYDFLRAAPPQETIYDSHFNNLGFRSQHDFQSQKAKGTYRIIIYGSYQAFGHGLNEEDTYAEQLETKLNSANKNKKVKKYEVWNSGRHAGSAIIGLAQYQHDVSAYQPDLVIMDYGFVDLLISDDDVMPFVLHMYPHLAHLIQWPLLMVNQVATNTLLGYSLLVKYSAITFRSNIGNFMRTMQSFLHMADKNKTPVIVLRQPQVQILGHVYREIIKTHPSVVFVNSDDVFEKNAPAFADVNPPKNFWLNEISEDQLRLLFYDPYFKYPHLKLDLWQTNQLGNSLIANELASVIKAKTSP